MTQKRELEGKTEEATKKSQELGKDSLANGRWGAAADGHPMLRNLNTGMVILNLPNLATL